MKCIICLTDEKLNTHMKVEVDNETYQVHLCDEHAETTTMGQVVKKVKEIKDRLKNAVQLAIDLGISIPEINAKPVPPPVSTIVPASAMPDLNIVTDSPETPTPDRVVVPNKITRNAAPIKLSDQEEINCDTEIELQEVEVRGGKIKIPKRTEGEAGVSDIKIINVDDKTIQDQFKRIKSQADSGSLGNGYAQNCRACNGTGTHPILKTTCPKCGGMGLTN